MGRVFDVLRELMGHQGDDVSGRAELNRLVFSLASICGDVVLKIDSLDEHIEELKTCLPSVIEAFSQWEAGQPPTDQTRLRSHLVAGFDAQPKWDIRINSVAAAWHVPVSDVTAMLDQLVSEGFLRNRGGKLTKVLRQPKKAAPTDPRQQDMFEARP